MQWPPTPAAARKPLYGLCHEPTAILATTRPQACEPYITIAAQAEARRDWGHPPASMLNRPSANISNPCPVRSSA